MELVGKRYGSRDWRKILTTRKGTFTVAAVCTVAAAGVLIFAMARYRSSVNASGTPETVFVAAQLIPKNTPADVIASEHLFRPTQVATKQVSSGAVADVALLNGQVAVRDIYPGEQLTAADFTPNGGLPAELAPAERAMTISLDQEHGMLGLVHDGDHVDVYAGVSASSATGQASPELRLLAADVPVLRAGSPTSGVGVGTSATGNGSPVTLKVPESEAGLLAFAADNGKVWLVLRPANATSTAPPSLITVQSLLFGTKTLPYGGAK